jgi:ATP-binding protein involved in chromosome partitioning
MSDSPISHHDPTKEAGSKGGSVGGKDTGGDGAQDTVGSAEGEAASGPTDEATNQQKQQMEQQYQQMRRKMRVDQLRNMVKHKFMVLSGKGGVGKTTVATGIALSMARAGKRIGLLDIDITGPNVPKMLGVTDTDLHVEDGQIHPAIGPHGLKVISMAFLIDDPDKPIIWRGPIKLGAIQQFIGDVAWGELDALIIDFPPGTSDEPLTVAQTLPEMDGVVIVTTPQEVALLDARKSINFAKTLKLPVLGVVENMSGYTLHGVAKDANGEPIVDAQIEVKGPKDIMMKAETDGDGAWNVTLDIFKRGGGEESAIDMDVPFLGRLPFDPGFVTGGDDGVHRIIAEPDGPAGKAFEEVVTNLIEQLEAGEDTAINIL